MAIDDNAGARTYRVVANDRGQHSILADHLALPTGWRDVGKSGPMADCLAYVDQVWNDMRARPLRTAGPTTPPRCGDGTGVETRDGIEAIWAQVFGVSISCRSATFFDLGGESLAAMRILSRIVDRWGIELTLEEFYDHASVDELAAAVERRVMDRNHPVPTKC